MKVNANIFWLLAVFFAVVAVAYSIWSYFVSLAQIEDYAQRVGPGGITEGHPEWVGTIALALCAVLAGFIAFYIGKVHKAQGGELPEDRLDANIDDGDPELGHFSPWSWWPIVLAGAGSLVMLGLAVGVWISFIGAALTFVAIVGWVYEYYRGNFSH
ncbi:cytochrome c oxidase subunit 4 [Salinibacterium sp. SYSU T00001]|uniref:cytochrome c oxidase subunit 4 n=1 Tax=Homoserinimonas sedimenticola TaxID=2986805 RepID=UPI0022356F4B|nr:cytochrome c oxidase subunit 4 [Salinibacterium sedimenticola]MCW4384298.1 cytochrome c oxidase subunit 4 [Salinibacterium sedimenticola]